LEKDIPEGGKLKNEFHWKGGAFGCLRKSGGYMEIPPTTFLGEEVMKGRIISTKSN
jgi:hypothetical protein